MQGRRVEKSQGRRICLRQETAEEFLAEKAVQQFRLRPSVDICRVKCRNVQLPGPAELQDMGVDPMPNPKSVQKPLQLFLRLDGNLQARWFIWTPIRLRHVGTPVPWNL